MSAVVTVRVPEELKEDLKKYKVESAEVARRAWEEEVKKRKLEAAREAAKELGKILAGVEAKDIVRMIREDRDTR
jgi:post-segregation antitoxin (ccd killing protein)